MKSENEINYFLTAFCVILLIFTVLGAKMLDHQEAMQQKLDEQHNR